MFWSANQIEKAFQKDAHGSDAMGVFLFMSPMLGSVGAAYDNISLFSRIVEPTSKPE